MQSHFDDDGRRLDGPAPDEQPLASTLVAHRDAPDELTIYPVDPVADEIMTHWITAKEGAYVSLHEWR